MSVILLIFISLPVTSLRSGVTVKSAKKIVDSEIGENYRNKAYN